MAYRLISLLPLLALCVSAANPSADGPQDMSEMDMDSVMPASSAAMASAVPPSPKVPGATTAAPVVQTQSESSSQAAQAGPPVISHAQANSVIQSAVTKALEIKSPSNIAVTDPYGHLVSFLRMDGAVLVSIDVAMKKAKTVSMFGGKFRTGDLYNATSPGGSLYGECFARLELQREI
jgi:hypothetical protein